MCDERRLVPIPAFLWDSGGVEGFDPTHPEYGLDEQGQPCLRLDSCIIPAVRALWDAGVMTLSCCCGHSDGTSGVITIRTVAAQPAGGARMARPLDLRTRDNRWIVKRQTDSREYEIVDNPYDAWLRQRTITSDGRTLPDQASFFAGWDALREWLMYGLGFEGRLSEYRRPAEEADRG